MTDFETEGIVTLVVPEREKEKVKREIQGIGSVPVSTDGGRATGAGGGDAARSLDRLRTDIEDLDRKATTRNDLLRELVDETEDQSRRIARSGGGGVGGFIGGGILGLLLGGAASGIDIPNLPPLALPGDSGGGEEPTEPPVEDPVEDPNVPPVPPIDLPEDIGDDSPTDGPTPDTPPTPGDRPPAPGDRPVALPNPDGTPDPTVPPVGAPDQPPVGVPDPDRPPAPGGRPAGLPDPDDIRTPSPRVAAGGAAAAGAVGVGAAAASKFAQATSTAQKAGVPVGRVVGGGARVGGGVSSLAALPAALAASRARRESAGKTERDLLPDLAGDDEPPSTATIGAGVGTMGNQATTTSVEVNPTFETNIQELRSTQEAIRKVKDQTDRLERELEDIQTLGGGL